MANPEMGEALMKVGDKDVLFAADFQSIQNIEQSFKDMGRPGNIYTIVLDFIQTSSTNPSISDLVVMLHGLCKDPTVDRNQIYRALTTGISGKNLSVVGGIMSERINNLLPALFALVDPDGVQVIFKKSKSDTFKGESEVVESETTNPN